MSDAPEHDHEVFGHEADHADGRKITIAVAGLTTLAVGAVFIVRGILMLLDAPEERDLLAAPEPVTPRPAVRGVLNPRQPEALSELRARAAMRLDSYGWVDRDAGVAHIPIERAMQMIVEQGVPKWSGGASEAGSDTDQRQPSAGPTTPEQ